MSKIMIFNPKTGEKIAECTGLVMRTDKQAEALDNLNVREKASIPELHFEAQVSKCKWYRLRRMAMGHKPRIPRKVKKAISHPCSRSKWHIMATRFTNRLWRDYCERTLPPGHCRQLQARLSLYLMIHDGKYIWRNGTLKCETPSGVKLAIFHTPKYYAGIAEHKFCWYGAVIYPNRKYGRVKYLDEHAATHLYKVLGEHIRDKVEQLMKIRISYDKRRNQKRKEGLVSFIRRCGEAVR